MGYRVGNIKKNQLNQLIVLFISIMITISILFDKEIIVSVEKVIVYLILVYCISRGLKEDKLINPYFLFIPVPLSLLIYNHTIGKMYLIELNTSTWYFVIMNMCVYLIAIRFTKKSKFNKDIFLESRKELSFNAWIFFGMYAIGGFITPLKSIFSLLQYPAIACALKSKKKITIILIYLFWFLLNMNSLQKTMVLGILFITLICFLKYNETKKINFKTIILIIISAIIMFLMFNLKDYLSKGGTFVEYVTGGAIKTSAGEYYTKKSDVLWNGNDNLFLPYMYIVTPWTNLQYVMTTQVTRTFGLWFLKPIIGWLQMDTFFSSLYQLESYSTFNTFTYLTVFFKDFGYFGSVLGSAFLGFFVQRMYKKYCYTTSPLDVAIYALTAQAALEMFFSNHFFQQSYPFTIIILIYIYRIIANNIYLSKKISMKT